MLAKNIDKKLPTVVVFGRTNVGKSTLFNCLTEKKQALVSDLQGTTRDSNIGQVAWQSHVFNIVDTGGFMNIDYLYKKNIQAETIDEKVQKQARELLTRADLILFLVDNKVGMLPQDKEIAEVLKKILPKTDNVMLVANKVDNFKQANASSEFYNLNLGHPYTISAATGSGTGDLLDEIIKRIKKTTSKEKIAQSKKQARDIKEKENINICILGKPNVGKSSLLNAILGYNRVIVSPIAHTTREPQNTDITYKKKEITIVDTAGIHKKGLKTKFKAKDKSAKIEKHGVEKSLNALKRSNVVLFVIDINEPLTHQDSKLVEEIFKQQKSLIIIANKWDLIEDKDTKKHKKDIYRELPFAQFVPIHFVSAKNNAKVDKIMDIVLELDKNRKIEIKESVLDDFIKKCIRRHKPTKGRGTKYPRIFKFKQEGSNPPNFVVKIGANENLAESYLNFLANQLRKDFGFIGTPLNIWVEKARSVHGQHKSDKALN